ncbi:DUF262 domain-containing protein [Aliarcobacter cryaerophilus]|uniref:DUF262 domain-containing protein n=1 Tax=Aliarcobacter cryaerophilus TaxID=28198 RepID=UPI0021B57472|nr:DUF262 domain-containing HNH endonuclease family protein [Aliarcobacter cryaerophilus]MCT7531312.1 DUF262 domain-containing HNH endonuclease family protein [Aliarcobacter cryaerophilus]
MDKINIIEELTLDQLKDKKYKFRIPLYQRKYAWTSDEVITLLDDLKTFSTKIDNISNEKYFIGNIVVEQKEDGLFDIIDGQQRFTTLFLIAKIIKRQYYELNYEIREEDDNFLKNFNYDETKEILYDGADIQFQENIEAILKFQKENNCKIENILPLCKIALTVLPDGIDIVKYFEVMNNRGKQLEKHQILKAKLLEVISDIKQKCTTDNINYAKIWDYCSNMNIYIEDSIYYGDLKKNEKDVEQKVRVHLTNFLKNNELIPEYFLTHENINFLTINAILDPNKEIDDTVRKEEFYVRKDYGSIVKFPIFIMQVFKIFITKGENKTILKNINDLVVNDRYLIDFFYDKDKQFVFDCDKSKAFIVFLFKMRILYDYFIFKRDDNDTPLLNITKNIFTNQNQDEVKNILMLQLLFNFTAPQRIAQDWLAVALSWLDKNFDQKDVYNLFSQELEKFDRTMALERLTMNKDLTGLVNKYLLKEEINLNSTTLNKDFFENKAQINSGTSTPHYWFYKLDYLLWKNDSIWKNLNLNLDLSKFRLSRLNSIEHIYPQQPLKPKEEWNNSQKLNNFGNLALISNHMNSSLNNRDYNEEKRGLLMNQLNKGTIESLKMILLYSKYKEWTPENCDEHQIEMINLLIGDLNNAK